MAAATNYPVYNNHLNNSWSVNKYNVYYVRCAGMAAAADREAGDVFIHAPKVAGPFMQMYRTKIHLTY